MIKHPLLLTLLLMISVAGCNRERDASAPTDTAVHQLGDVMAGMDESSGASGSFVSLYEGYKSVVRMEQERRLLPDFQWLAKAHAGACATEATFGTCSSNTIVRNFLGCTIGSATVEGRVDLTFTDAVDNDTCQMTQAGHSVSRVPELTIQGSRGGSLQISLEGTNGQVITRGAAPNDYTFSNDGIQRVLRWNDRVVADWTTSTTADISLTGSARNGRVANGGTLQVLNNRNNESCDFSPSSVTWGASCNCAISGEWTFTCSNGDSGSYEITGCGQGTLTIGDSTESVTLEQCSSL